VTVIFATAAVGLVHYIDKGGILTGTTTTWEAPTVPGAAVTYQHAVQIG